MRVLLVRHGETVQNTMEIVQGHTHGELTITGRAQARAIAKRLSSETLDAIIGSDLLRAKETAETIGQFHACEQQYLSLIRERGYGIFETKPASEYFAALEGSGLPLLEYVPPGGEGLSDLYQRAITFHSWLKERNRDRTVTVVSHGGFNRLFLGIALGMSIEESWKIKQNNTCLNILDLDSAGNWSVQLVNCTLHLESSGQGSYL